MNLFEWLLIGHLVGDYLLQNRWMAENKSHQLVPLLLHSAIYSTAIFLCSLPAGGITFTSVAIVFLTHVILDKRSLVRWWSTHITKSPDVLWLQIMIDQTFHLLVLALIVNF